VTVEPVLFENSTEEGRTALTDASKDLDPQWPLGLTIDGWTTYSVDEIINCKGPGES
jgi:ribose transport system substrate-binding protein